MDIGNILYKFLTIGASLYGASALLLTLWSSSFGLLLRKRFRSLYSIELGTFGIVTERQQTIFKDQVFLAIKDIVINRANLEVSDIYWICYTHTRVKGGEAKGVCVDVYAIDKRVSSLYRKIPGLDMWLLTRRTNNNFNNLYVLVKGFL